MAVVANPEIHGAQRDLHNSKQSSNGGKHPFPPRLDHAEVKIGAAIAPRGEMYDVRSKSICATRRIG